ncbi:MAG: hypothetical protein K5666_04055 [Bacilli bacterium]|nr:hypothetical protein [Bacilli bacterium]
MYIIKKTKHDSSIEYMEYDDPAYEVKLDINKFAINNLYVYDKKYLPKSHNLLPFEYVFAELANHVFGYIYSDEDDDDSDTTFSTLLGEVEKANAMLESQYKEFLKRQEYYTYLDKISFLKEELYNKLEINKYNRNINSLISGKSR